jgi:Sel1 repeat
MKVRWAMIAAICLPLLCAVIYVPFHRRQLAKRAAACRIRAEQGDAESQFRLGSIYFYGRGVSRDDAEAVDWYRKSAEHGYARGEYGLSNMYREGRGVSQDYAEASRWCRKAAEQGYAKAQAALGFMYYSGKGAPQDYSEAVRWYRKAADQGEGNAQYSLGYMYFNGIGVPQDRAEADVLFREAATQGNEDARRAIRWKTTPSLIMSKIIPAIKFAAGLSFLIFFLRSRQKPRNRVDISMGVAAVLTLLFFLSDLFWYSYIGHLRSPSAFTALYLLRHFLGGIIVALLVLVVFRTSTAVVLLSAAALFSGFVALQIVFSEFKETALTIRLFCFVGFPLGMMIPSAIFLLLDRRTNGQVLGGKVEAI